MSSRYDINHERLGVPREPSAHVQLGEDIYAVHMIPDPEVIARQRQQDIEDYQALEMFRTSDGDLPTDYQYEQDAILMRRLSEKKSSFNKNVQKASVTTRLAHRLGAIIGNNLRQP